MIDYDYELHRQSFAHGMIAGGLIVLALVAVLGLVLVIVVGAAWWAK
jgi:hypothetical protein